MLTMNHCCNLIEGIIKFNNQGKVIKIWQDIFFASIKLIKLIVWWIITSDIDVHELFKPLLSSFFFNLLKWPNQKWFSHIILIWFLLWFLFQPFVGISTWLSFCSFPFPIWWMLSSNCSMWLDDYNHPAFTGMKFVFVF